MFWIFLLQMFYINFVKVLQNFFNYCTNDCFCYVISPIFWKLLRESARAYRLAARKWIKTVWKDKFTEGNEKMWKKILTDFLVWIMVKMQNKPPSLNLKTKNNMKLHSDINQNIPEEIRAGRVNRAARIRAEKNSEKRIEKIIIAHEKVQDIRRGRHHSAIFQESNKPYTAVRVSASLARKLTGKN